MGEARGGERREDDILDGVRSLGFRTSIALLLLSGSTVSDHGDHLLVGTVDNRDFWWGNFVLLLGHPSVEQSGEWVGRFEEELPWAAHRAFGLDDPDAPVGAFRGFIELGYRVDRSCVMTTGSVHATSDLTPGVTCRVLSGDDDWRQHVELSLRVYPGFGQDGGRLFAQARAGARRRVIEGGAGVWVGAFVEGRLVSQLGVMSAGRGVARFQNVETHPRFRRRGLAGALVVLASDVILSSFAVDTLVVVADPDDEAIRLYRSLGFVGSEHQLEASRSPR